MLSMPWHSEWYSKRQPLQRYNRDAFLFLHDWHKKESVTLSYNLYSVKSLTFRRIFLLDLVIFNKPSNHSGSLSIPYIKAKTVATWAQAPGSWSPVKQLQQCWTLAMRELYKWKFISCHFFSVGMVCKYWRDGGNSASCKRLQFGSTSVTLSWVSTPTLSICPKNALSSSFFLGFFFFLDFGWLWLPSSLLSATSTATASGWISCWKGRSASAPSAALTLASCRSRFVLLISANYVNHELFLVGFFWCRNLQ